MFPSSTAVGSTHCIVKLEGICPSFWSAFRNTAHPVVGLGLPAPFCKARTGRRLLSGVALKNFIPVVKDKMLWTFKEARKFTNYIGSWNCEPRNHMKKWDLEWYVSLNTGMSRGLEKKNKQTTNRFLMANEMELDNFTLEKQPSRGQHEHTLHSVTNN